MGSTSTVFSIHVRPHVRKYLMVRWAPGDHLADPAMRKDLKLFSDVLRREILHAELDAQLSERPRSELRLCIGEVWGTEVGERAWKHFNYRAEVLYREHFHEWARFAMSYTPRTVSQVVQDWYARFGLQDEDLPLATSKQSFLRYRKREDMVMARGGARPGTRVYSS